MADGKLLLISYLFPPAGGIPVQRALSLSRYLPRNGYEVHVLCCRNPGIPNLDPSLLKRIPGEVHVHRAFSPELPFAVRQAAWALLAPGRKAAAAAPAAPPVRGKPSALKAGVQQVMRRVFCPDPEVIWVPFAVRKARQVIREHGIDTVIVTVPPFSSLLVGLRLKREFPHIKFIADFRDEWLDYYLNAFDFYRSGHIQARAAAIEREVAAQASLITCVTPSVREQMRQRYADVPAEKFALIYNGFDPEPFADFRPRPHGTGKVLVTYAGTLHGTSSPKPYFDALDRLPDNLRDMVETRLIGRITDEEARYLDGRKSAIRKYGFLPQAEAFRHMEESDYLMLIQHHAPSLGGKFFEYMATGKPILAISPEHGETARILKETGSGLCAYSSAPGAIEAMLTQAVEYARQGRPICSQDRSAVERFDRRIQAAEYAERMREARP